MKTGQIRCSTKRYARHWRVETTAEQNTPGTFMLQYIPARGDGPPGPIRVMRPACGTRSNHPTAFQRNVPESTEDKAQVTCKRCLKYIAALP